MNGKVHHKLQGNYVWPSTFGFLKHSLVCKGMLKNRKQVEIEMFLGILIIRRYSSMRFVFGMHNDECMKGLERHKIGIFIEYMRKSFENARSYK